MISSPKLFGPAATMGCTPKSNTTRGWASVAVRAAILTEARLDGCVDALGVRRSA